MAARQKYIHLADYFEYGWVTVEAYDDDELADNPMNEKKMADAEEAAWKVTRNRKTKSKGSYQSIGGGDGGDYRRCPLGDQVPVTNPGPSKPPELKSRPVEPCQSCGGFGHIVANCP